MRFEHPLFLLLFIPFLAMLFYQIRGVLTPTIKYTNLAALRKIEHRSTKYISQVARFLRYLILALMIITMAKPQLIDSNKQVSSEGIDIMLVLDTSRSMAAEDMQPSNRLEAAKDTIKNFISKRLSDRIGLVVFGSDAYTLCPLTLDYSILGNFIDDIDISMAGNGTSIGMGIAVGLNRLKDSDTKSKVMILLTDGENNGGDIDPIRASQLAKDLGVKVYTIGVGKDGVVKIPYMHPIKGKDYLMQSTQLDEDSLRKIAVNTNAAYFRSTDTDSLKEIYSKIDSLEKSSIKTEMIERFSELFPKLLTLIFMLMLVELLVFNIVFVVTP